MNGNNGACGARISTAPPSATPRWAVWNRASEGGRGAALALLAIGAYLPALAGGFVWDDWIFVAEPLIRRWDGLASIWLSPAEVKDEHHYWPIVYSTFWLEHKLWGFHAAGYHAVNLLLHAVNALLVWRLLLRLEVPGAWLAAAVFAVHPVHVESVAWIIERKDLLSALFYLCAMHAWLGYTETHATRRLVQSVAFFVAAMLSKSIAVTLPAALLLLGWWRKGHIAWRDVGRLLPFLVLAAGITAADLFFYWGQSSYHFDYTVVERALIAARSLWLYLGQLAWPVSLPILYSRWEVSASDATGWVAAAALCAFLAALWFGRRHIGRGPVAALAFFVLTLSPVLGFLDFSFLRIAFLADRFAYLASLGPIAVVAGIAARSSTLRLDRGQVVTVGLIVLTLAALSAQTWRQAGAYRDDLVLARHISLANPEHYFGQLLLAHALVEDGRHEEGFKAARNAVHLAEGDRGADKGGAVAAVGGALLAADRAADAEERFRQALAIGPKHAEHRLNLARALVVQARYGEGLRLYRDVAREEPASDHAITGQAEAMFLAGNLPAAKDAFLQALPLARDPRSEPAIHRRLGETLRRMGELDAAAEHLDRALSVNPRDVQTLLLQAAVEADRERGSGSHPDSEPDLDATGPGRSTSHQWIEQAREIVEAAIGREPDRADARVLLADIFHRLGKYPQAMGTLEGVLSANPNRPLARKAHRLMGEMLESQGQPDRAKDHYRQALALYPLDADALLRLAAIHVRAGRDENALLLYRRLADVTPCNAENLSRLAETLARVGRSGEDSRSARNGPDTPSTTTTASERPPAPCRPPP